MSRVRWLNIDWPESIDTLIGGMLSCQFSENVDEGFIINKRSHNECTAKFIHKYSVFDQITDPFGNSYEEKRVVYDTVNFKINNNSSFGLELYNAPQRIRPFFNALNRLSDGLIVINREQIDLMDWLSKFEKLFKPVRLNYIECSGINVANKGTAKVVIKSQQDIKNEAFDYLGKGTYSIDLIKFSFMEESKICKFEASRHASVKMEDDIEHLFIPLFRESLRALDFT